MPTRVKVRWWSGSEGKVGLKQGPTSCALAAAAADASFPGPYLSRSNRNLAGGSSTPTHSCSAATGTSLDSGRFDPYGRNLAETLYSLNGRSPGVLDQIVEATRSVVGLPKEIETRESEGGFYFVQTEPGLQYPVHTRWGSPAARCACLRS